MRMLEVKKLREIIRQMIEPVRQRVMMTIARGVIESINDATGIQLAKVNLLAGENRDKVERFQQYGLTSVPKANSEAVVLFAGGNRETGLIISIDDRNFRLKGLEEGEVALYTDEGDKIHFQRNKKIVIESDNVEIGRGTLEKIVNGETFRQFFNVHPHLGNLGVPTGPPQTLMQDATHLSQKVKAAK